MAFIPATIVAQPQSLGRRPGLFSAAIGPLDLPSPHGRGGGIQYEDETCGTAHPYPLMCEPEDRPEKTFDDGNPQVEARPFAVLASMVCGSVGYTEAEFTAKIVRRLEDGEQHAAELALWTGEDEAGNTLDIETIGDAPDVAGTQAYDPASLASIVAALEQHAYGDQRYGQTAFLHAPVSVAAWAAEARLIVRDGPLYRTPFGSVWVFGGGYPDGEGLRITGQTTVWRAAEPFVFPVHQASLNRASNQVHLLAEREYAVAFDCLAGSAEFNPLGS